MSSQKMPWFRMYVDFLNDPKMIGLAFEDQRHFIGLLALKSDGALDGDIDPALLDRIVAQRLWIDHAVIRDVKKRLVNAGLIDANWQPLAWDKRQMKSDADSTAAERQRRSRAAKNAANNVGKESGGNDVTVMSRVTDRDSHADVTRLDTDTDTDTDKEDSYESLSPGFPDDDAGEPAKPSEAADQADQPATKQSLPACPHLELLDIFAEQLPELPQPKPELWEGQRAKNLSARWKWCLTAKKRSGARYATTKAEALDFFRRYFGYVGKSDFLTGRDGRWAGCDLAWLVKADNFAKVLQGNYENRQEAAA